MPGRHEAIQQWVDEISRMVTPDRVVYCDGSEAERDALIRECLATGELIELNQQKLPGCYLHRSAPHDVARTEHLTFVSTREPTTMRAPPTTGWRRTRRDAKLTPLFQRRDEGPHACSSSPS